MTPGAFLARIVDPGISFLHELSGPGISDAARRLLLAIALQESGPELVARYQNSPNPNPGPARGFYQFERSGGCAGVLNHRASAAAARRVCTALTVLPDPAAVWRALEGHDVLATCFARLLLYTDPAKLPEEADPAWEYYRRTWRPGKPHPNVWERNWNTAALAVEQAPFTFQTAGGEPVQEEVIIVVRVPRGQPVLVTRAGDSTAA